MSTVRERRLIATPPVAGNAMTLPALPSVTPFAHAQNVKCSVSRLNAPNALFTANSLNARFVAPRICVKKTRARNAKPFAPRHSVTPLVLHPKLTVHLSVKRPHALGHVPNPPPARVLSVSCSVVNPLVTSKTSRSVANAVQKAQNSLSPQHLALRRYTLTLKCSRHSWKWLHHSNTPQRMAWKSVARAPRNKVRATALLS